MLSGNREQRFRDPSEFRLSEEVQKLTFKLESLCDFLSFVKLLSNCNKNDLIFTQLQWSATSPDLKVIHVQVAIQGVEKLCHMQLSVIFLTPANAFLPDFKQCSPCKRT